ncbi:guanine nucleotide binding protein, alpha subunit [Mycena capillaripes]|nr:guanine nucleotide binding protein, alpha subunit [Mycena capillaripes]
MGSFDVDPIAAALAPPEDESEEERQSRLLTERAAKRVSDDIDDQLSRERQQVKRQPKPVKILLLGQSESGKSTTLKNFQLMCEPEAFRRERASWRAIIHLNVIRSVSLILDALSPGSAAADPPSARSSCSSRDSLRPDADLLGIRMRLLPLGAIGDAVSRRLTTPDDAPGTPQTPTFPSPVRRRAGKEIALNSTVAWKEIFMRGPSECDSDSFNGDEEGDDLENSDDPRIALYEHAEDMRRLWAHPTVQAILEHRGLRLQESSGFFLDELDIVTSKAYIPTDDHILRARLKTLGVSEHRMRLTDLNGGITREFRIFDVGGQRTQRPKWVPYFDDVDCILFVAPVSAFDQMLEEEPEINRLADSIELWTRITSNKLLGKTNMILFLNKVDVLKAKLASGIRFSDYVDSYGRRPNDFDSTSRYIEKQFGAILKRSSPLPRPFYCHLTNAIDTKAMRYVLAGIKDMLLRSHLNNSILI